MKYQILAGTLGLVLLLGLSPLPAAEAKIFIVDNFTNDPLVPSCDLSDSAGPVGNTQMTMQMATGVIGGWRMCSLTIDAINPPSNVVIDVVAIPDDVIPADMFRHMAGTGVESTVMLAYNANAAGLGVNLLNSDDIRIVYSTSDQLVDVTVRVTDSGGDFAEQFSQLAIVISTPTELLFDIATFAVVNPLVNLNDIDEIKFTFATTIAFTDYDLDLLDITMEMVGGEMFPVDTTALLLAGAELNAIWILPAIAAIGIGAFVVSRKRK